MPPAEESPVAELERDEGALAWIYGSILTATAVVVATTIKEAIGPGRVFLYPGATMAVVWLAHGYAAFVGHGGRVEIPGLGRRLVHALGTELPVLASAGPTLVAIAVCWIVGATVSTTGLVGLGVATVTMVAVASAAARRAGASRRGIIGAGASALVIGSALIAAKLALK